MLKARKRITKKQIKQDKFVTYYFKTVDFIINDKPTIAVSCTVKSISKTGAEMEALIGVSIALLNIWDVVKMYEKDENGQYPSTSISDIKVKDKIKKIKF